MESAKPLVKWVIGNTNNDGIKCLVMSVNLFRQVYGDIFDYVVCYNRLSSRQIMLVKTLLPGVKTVNQVRFLKFVDLPPGRCGSAWKLVPPRLNRWGHEITIDNDLIIHDKLPQLDNFLKSGDLFLITEAIERHYGIYNDCIDKDLQLNSGFVGLPPAFNFDEAILKNIRGRWVSYFDEQGLVASVIAKQKFKLIPLEDVFVCRYESKLGNCGEHWVGLNAGLQPNWWRAYRNAPPSIRLFL